MYRPEMSFYYITPPGWIVSPEWVNYSLNGADTRSYDRKAPAISLSTPPRLTQNYSVPNPQFRKLAFLLLSF